MSDSNPIQEGSPQGALPSFEQKNILQSPEQQIHQYPFWQDTLVAKPIADVEAQVLNTEVTLNPATGEKANYEELVNAFLEKIPQTPVPAGQRLDTTVESLDKLSKLEDRVRYFGDYAKKADPITDLTQGYDYNADTLLMAIELRRVQLMKEANAKLAVEPDYEHKKSPYKIPETILEKSLVQKPQNIEEIIPPDVIEKGQEREGLKKIAGQPEPDKTVEEPEVPDETNPDQPEPESPAPPEAPDVPSADDDIETEEPEEPEDSPEPLAPDPAIPPAATPPEITPPQPGAGEPEASAEPGVSVPDNLHAAPPGETTVAHNPDDLMAAPVAPVETRSGPLFKDGFIIASVAAQNRLSDQIQMTARHLRSEKNKPPGLLKFVTKFLPRSIQNRLLRGVFEGREMRFAADLDRASKKNLKLGESIPLSLDADFAQKALDRGQSWFRTLPWYARISSQIGFIPARILSGTTGIIESPAQWKARGWARHSEEAKKILNGALRKSMSEQNSLASRFALVDRDFSRITAGSIENMNEHILSGVKQESRHLYTLPADIQLEIKRRLEIYASAPFPGQDDELNAKSLLLKDINTLLQEKVFKNGAIITDKKERSALQSSEIASNILSIAQDVRSNKNHYFKRGENGRRTFDELQIKFLAGEAWWGKARQAEATGLIGKSINERLAERLAQRNYRWDRGGGHKAVNAAVNIAKDFGLYAGAYTLGASVAVGDNILRKGGRALAATPLGMVGGSIGVGALNALKESGVVWNNNGRLYGIGGNYLQEFVQHSHEMSIGRNSPANERIRKELEEITVKRLDADKWISEMKKIVAEDNITGDEEKRNQLLVQLIEAKARMQLTDASSKKEGLKLAMVQNFIQYKENQENDQAFQMHSLFVNGISKLVMADQTLTADRIRELTYVRQAQLKIGDNISGIIQSVNEDLANNGKPPLSYAQIQNLNFFLETRGLRVAEEDSLAGKSKLLMKLSYQKAGKAFVATAVSAIGVGLVAKPVMSAVREVMDKGGDLGALNYEIRTELNEWRRILGDRHRLPVYFDDKGEVVNNLSSFQKAVLRVRESLNPVTGTDEVIQVDGKQVRLPPQFEYVDDGSGHRAIFDTRTGDILDLSGGKNLLIEPDGDIVVKDIAGKTVGMDAILASSKVEHVIGVPVEKTEEVVGTVYPAHEQSVFIDGKDITTKIPEGSTWMKDETGKMDLIFVDSKGVKHILIDDAYIKNGNLKGTLDEGIKISENETRTVVSEKLSSEGSLEKWKDMTTPIKQGERFWTNNTAQSDKSELRLFNRVENVTDGNGNTYKAVVLDADGIGKARLGSEVVDATALAKENKILFAFRLGGHYREPIIVQGSEGILKLDPTDTSHFVYGPDGSELMVDGHKVTVAEFSTMILNQKALENIPEGNLASEYTNRPFVFNLKPEGERKDGLIGAYFISPDGKYNSLAQTIGTNQFGTAVTQQEVVTSSTFDISASKMVEVTKTVTGNEIRLQSLPIDIHTPELWFIPLHARQNIERSVTSSTGREPGAQIKSKGLYLDKIPGNPNPPQQRPGGLRLLERRRPPQRPQPPRTPAGNNPIVPPQPPTRPPQTPEQAAQALRLADRMRQMGIAPTNVPAPSNNQPQRRTPLPAELSAFNLQPQQQRTLRNTINQAVSGTTAPNRTQPSPLAPSPTNTPENQPAPSTGSTFNWTFSSTSPTNTPLPLATNQAPRAASTEAIPNNVTSLNPNPAGSVAEAQIDANTTKEPPFLDVNRINEVITSRSDIIQQKYNEYRKKETASLERALAFEQAYFDNPAISDEEFRRTKGVNRSDITLKADGKTISGEAELNTLQRKFLSTVANNIYIDLLPANLQVLYKKGREFIDQFKDDPATYSLLIQRTSPLRRGTPEDREQLWNQHLLKKNRGLTFTLKEYEEYERLNSVVGNESFQIWNELLKKADQLEKNYQGQDDTAEADSVITDEIYRDKLFTVWQARETYRRLLEKGEPSSVAKEVYYKSQTEAFDLWKRKSQPLFDSAGKFIKEFEAQAGQEEKKGLELAQRWLNKVSSQTEFNDENYKLDLDDLNAANAYLLHMKNPIAELYFDTRNFIEKASTYDLIVDFENYEESPKRFKISFKNRFETKDQPQETEAALEGSEPATAQEQSVEDKVVEAKREVFDRAENRERTKDQL